MASIKHIPIAKGAHIPIIKQFNNDSGFHFTDGLGDAEELKSFEYDDIEILSSLAPLKIIELVKKYPNEINLLCVGPLTNIATAYMLWPEIVNKLGFIYVMGGSTKCFGNHICTAEYNSAYDFISTKIVFDNFKNLIITPWEPTESLTYNQIFTKEIKKDFDEKGIKYNESLYSYWEIILKNYDLRNKGVGLEICDLYSIIPAFNFDSVKKFFISDMEVVIDSRENVGMTVIRNKTEYKGTYEEFWKSKINSKDYLGSRKIVFDQLNKDELHKEFLTIFTELC